MKVLVTGATGQLGQALIVSAPAEIELVAADRKTLNLGDPAAAYAAALDIRADVIINAGAYTAVDKAETERALATTVNAEAPRALARAAAEQNSRLIQLSTDFVFSGATERPRAPEASTAPINHYGASKLAGEQACIDVLGEQACIVRTAWVYAPWGQNFLLSMLKLMASRAQLGIVADQIGTPTSALGLSNFLWQLCDENSHGGTWHWTDAGSASWYDFAAAIYQQGRELGLLANDCNIAPIRTEDFPTAAARPGFSVLDKTSTWEHFSTSAPHWQAALTTVMQRLANKEQQTNYD